MDQKVFRLRLMVLFLGFFVVVSGISAVPSTRSLKQNEAVQGFLAQDVLGVGENGEELLGHIEGRMDMESTTDYPGTGANNHHDPRSPGKP